MIRSRQFARFALAAMAVVSVARGADATLDEHMILVLPTVIVTFDRSTVRFAGRARMVRIHLYLPAPDADGHVGYQSTQDIDCAAKRSRDTAVTGVRADGTVDVVKPEQAGFVPIVADTPIAVLRDHVCAIEDKPNYPAGGVMLQVPGVVAARTTFALVKLGLEPEQAAQLSSRDYGDRDALTESLDAQKIAPAKRAQVIATLGSLVAEAAKPPPPIVPLDAAVRSGRVGRYVHVEMELGAEIRLMADGTFAYGLTVGSLDETAQGKWTATGDRIALSAGATTAARGDVDFSGWQVTCDGRVLTIVRDGQRMVFARRGR